MLISDTLNNIIIIPREKFFRVQNTIKLFNKTLYPPQIILKFYYYKS
jgi:hypothetical protein